MDNSWSETSPSSFEHRATPRAGVVFLARKAYADERGDFGRLYCETEVGAELFAGKGIAQSNLARNRATGTLGGLHVLLPPAQEHKLVTCVQGSIWDVVVDLRPESPTRLRWFGVGLRADENLSLIIPPGVAHRYQTLVPDSTVLYLHSQEYVRELDAGVRADGPDLEIAWSLPITVISARDADLPSATGFIADHG